MRSPCASLSATLRGTRSLPKAPWMPHIPHSAVWRCRDSHLYERALLNSPNSKAQTHSCAFPSHCLIERGVPVHRATHTRVSHALCVRAFPRFYHPIVQQHPSIVQQVSLVCILAFLFIMVPYYSMDPYLHQKKFGAIALALILT
jgi:hypothetical protein